MVQNSKTNTHKEASTKNFCPASQIFFVMGLGWGRGLSEFVKKAKFVTKIIFSDNVE